jgi:hypothetical protein
MRILKNVLMIFSAVALVACGGGGGGGDAVPFDTNSKFNLSAIVTSYAQMTGAKNVSISGAVNGVSVTGSGTVTLGTLQPITFEGSSALAKTTSASLTISANGQSIPISNSSRSIFSTQFKPLGSIGEEYAVVTSYTEPPTAAKVNDTGTWMVSTRYSSSSKFSQRGTTTTTYSIIGESDSTAILTIIAVDRSTAGTFESSSSSKFRITTANSISPLSETYTDSSQTLTLTYQ